MWMVIEFPLQIKDNSILSENVVIEGGVAITTAV